ncbi:unnamed protein product [Cuscuta europaea]|uniref:Probable purine permease n=2 Tax=Cuscuta europaea TaxID=41803 RepID=A0A9P0Z510_CUSEU|nr:unnamed protein product [Cuscuta europaea]
MDTSQEVELQNQGNDFANNQLELPSPRKNRGYTWWVRIGLYIIFLVAGESAGTLLGRFYYDKGGNSMWTATLVQSAGFPVFLPLCFFSFSSSSRTGQQPRTRCSTRMLLLPSIYVFFGALSAATCLMYSYGLLFLPVSTYSLLCATQLAFNVLFSFLINAHRFTPLVLNSVVLVTVSAALLAVHSDDTTASRIPRGKYVVGILCTVGASAAYSLYLSLLELSFKKVIKRETFDVVLDMQVYPSFIATFCCVVGLFGSGEWRSLKGEMDGFGKGKVSYVMTLVWTALSWQIFSVGLLGLVFEVSSLFSNVISTIGLPIVPVMAVILFGDKMDGVKVIALLLALWGFLSYVYQHYLDDSKPNKPSTLV